MRVLRIFHSAVVDAWRERERQFAVDGVDVELLTALRWNEGGSDVPLRARPDESVRGLRTWGRHPALFVYSPGPLWRALGKQWDVIDIHEEPFALATAEILLLRRLRRQQAPYLLYSAQNIDKRYPVPFRWLERWALRNAAGLSVCNAEAGRICVRKGFPGRASLIPLGVDVERFSPATKRLVAQPAVIGYAGRLAPHKGVDVLIDALTRIEDVVLRVAGAGPAEAALRAQACALGVADRVDFVGGIPQEELPAFYQGLDVLAVPSLPTPGWREQFGRVAVEAMACGIPVVASDTGALPDVVGGAGLLVPPGAPDLLAMSLVSATTPSPQRESLLEQGLARARACSWPEVAKAHRRLYESAVRPAVQPSDRGIEIIVVAYGRPDLLAAALDPVRSFPVTVVDNSSSREVVDVCKQYGVRYLDPGYNGGFAAGVNAGLANRLLSDADVLLLNPDAVIEAPGVRALQKALLADPSLASVAPAQIDESGEPGRVSWPFPSPGRAWLTAVGLGRWRPGSGFVIGSVLMLRAEALDQVGEFDDEFFLYAEETDWAYRAHRLGWRHREVKDVRAVHLGSATSADARQRDSHFDASQERYLRKHHGSLGWQVARAATITGALVRAAVLPGGRGRAARARASTYLAGPLRSERALRAPVGES